jgi:hypothetical protein
VASTETRAVTPIAKSIAAKPISVFRAVVRVPGINTKPIVAGSYWTDRGKAELDRMRFIRDRQARTNPSIELYETQTIPAFLLEDGRVAVVVPIG